MREDPAGLADGLATGGKQFVMVSMDVKFCRSYISDVKPDDETEEFFYPNQLTNSVQNTVVARVLILD